MGARLTDSAAYAHLWGTDDARAIFDDDARVQTWLDVLVALADAQAEQGIIPTASAEAIRVCAQVDHLDLDFIASETRRTSHSTLGLINGLKQVLPPDAAEHVYYGVTVQDVTDTGTSLAMRRTALLVERDLRSILASLASLADTHRTTAMAGRTHGQPGAPITFGLKAASWADELARHLVRLTEGGPRWFVGQLGGAVGTLGFFGTTGPALRASFCARLQLADPGISWTASRDRGAEFAHLLAMITATLARIGNEVMELQRPEIGELREPTSADAVGSITMPHKRNPERGEHLDTLARIVRSQSAVMLEAMVQLHERDGRGWKAEWFALPEVCLLTCTAVAMARNLIEGLEVDVARMAANIDASGGHLSSERLLSALAPKLGKHAAQAQLQLLLAEAQRNRQSLADAVVIAGLLTAEQAAACVAETAAPLAAHDVRATIARVRSLLADR
jgi:adenylosuccinate lyase